MSASGVSSIEIGKREWSPDLADSSPLGTYTNSSEKDNVTDLQPVVRKGDDSDFVASGCKEHDDLDKRMTIDDLPDENEHAEGDGLVRHPRPEGTMIGRQWWTKRDPGTSRSELHELGMTVFKHRNSDYYRSHDTTDATGHVAGRKLIKGDAYDLKCQILGCLSTIDLRHDDFANEHRGHHLVTTGYTSSKSNVSMLCKSCLGKPKKETLLSWDSPGQTRLRYAQG